MLRTVLPLMLVTVAAVLFSYASPAQITPVAGTGCAGPPPLAVTGGPPKPTAVLNVSCPQQPCCIPGTPSVVFLGICLTTPLPLPSGLGCGPACFLGCPPTLTIPGPAFSLPPLPSAVGATFCLQCACISVSTAGLPCVCLSEKVNVTIVPPPC